METWHQRLERAVKARGLSYADLVRATKLAKPSVYAWRPAANDRTTMMAGDNAAIVCDLLRISPMWLFHGRSPLPDFEQPQLMVAESGIPYSTNRQWPWHPASQTAYEALNDEAKGWVKCRLADAIDEASRIFPPNGASAAA